MNKTTNEIKYILYARKSSESEDRQALSLDAQEHVLTELAERHHLAIAEVLRESHSAKEPNRRAVFSEMTKKIKSGKAQGILCWKLDRLARNPDEAGMIIGMLQRGEIQNIRTSDKEYRPDDNSLLSYLEFGMANQYIRDLGSNVKRGLHEKARRGIYPIVAPFGYLNDPYAKKGNKAILSDPDRFPLLRKMFDLILGGHHTPVQVWRIACNDWKLTTRQGTPISRANIYRIITNPVYAGIYEYPQGSGEWHKGIHEPVITAEEYDKIQIILGRKGKPRPKKHVFAFTGLMKCGECGGLVTAEDKVKRQKNGNVHTYVYYHCIKRINPDCSQGCIEEAKLKEQILGRLTRISIPPEFHEWALNWLRNDIKQNTPQRVKIRETQMQKRAEYEKKLDNLLDMRAGGELSKEQFQAKNAEYTLEKMRLDDLLAQGGDKTQKILDKADECLTLARDAADEFVNGGIEKRRRIVIKIGQNPSLKDRLFNICIEKPFIELENISKAVRGIHAALEPAGNPVNKKEIGRLYARNLIVRWG